MSADGKVYVQLVSRPIGFIAIRSAESVSMPDGSSCHQSLPFLSFYSSAELLRFRTPLTLFRGELTYFPGSGPHRDITDLRPLVCTGASHFSCFVSSSGFRSLSTLYSASQLASLFHLAATSRTMCLFRGFSLRVAVLSFESPCPLAVVVRTLISCLMATWWTPRLRGFVQREAAFHSHGVSRSSVRSPLQVWCSSRFEHFRRWCRLLGIIRSWR